MRLSRTSIQKAVAGVIGTGMVAAGTANAGLVYDLRFADGSHTKTITSGGTYSVEVWGQVSGTNASVTDEGLSNSYINIRSSSGTTAAIAGAGSGITNGQLVAPWATGSGRAGGGQDLNGDGILDWGSNSTSSADTNYMYARTSTVGGEVGGGTLGQALGATGWQFKLATFDILVNGVGADGGITSFNVIKPASTNVVAVTYATAKVDNTTFNVSSSNQQGAYTGSIGLSFVSGAAPIPEPASLGLLGIAAVGLLRRKK